MQQSTKPGENVICLEDMLNEAFTINNKYNSNTQLALELVDKLESLQLIQDESALTSQNGAGTYTIV